MKIVLFLSMVLSQVVASDFIEIYSAYTNSKRVVVEGRVIDIKDKKDESSKLIGAFFNDEKKNIEIFLNINQQKYSVKTDKEGYFLFDLKNLSSLSEKQVIKLETDDKSSLESIILFQPNSQAKIGVISDFDDTVIISNVTEKTKLLYDTFFKNYKERDVISSVEVLIKETLRVNNSNVLFFITGSPSQLQNSIHLFLNFHNFPNRVVLTKKLHGSNKDSLFSSVAYKYEKIVNLIEMYPHIKWVFFGDSGEKDQEIYLKIRKNYPNKIEKIYIRSVKTKKVSKI